LNSRGYVLASAPVEGLGFVAVALPLPPNYREALSQLDQSERRYQELRFNNKLIRQTYMQALLLITLLVLFGTTWSALALSKVVTRPVTALAEGTEAISAGRLDYRVEVPAGDELGQLVNSFNSMAAELESNRRQLQDVNVTLEERRLHMETILESIPSGVLSLDGTGQVTRVNAALIRMFQPKGSRCGRGDSAADAQVRPHGHHQRADGDSERRHLAGGGRDGSGHDGLATAAAQAGLRDRL
jgi:hypothetical protein